MTGSCEFTKQNVDQLRPERWTYKRFKGYRSRNVPQNFWSSGADDCAAGLTTYRNVNDVDRYCNDSADDTCSNTDSSYDSASIVSSQSSHPSATTDVTDLPSDEDIADIKHVFQTSINVQEVQSRINEQAELLQGLDAQPLTKQNIDSIQGSSSWEADQRAPLLQALPGIKSTRPSQDVDSITRAQPPASSIKCNRRRSGSHSSTAGPPCKLKRDTDSTDCFVTLLIIFATRLITAIWPLSASPPMMTSCFNGAGVLPLRVFIQETLRRSKTSYSTLQVALFYLILLKNKLSDNDFTKEQLSQDSSQNSGEKSTCRAMQCGRRMFLAALMLASKYLQDRNYSTRAWSKISGLRSTEINENETEYLKSIDYNLHITKESFENWSKIVLTLSKLSKLQPGCQLKSRSSPPSSGSGMDSILAEMLSGTDGSDLGEDQLYSDEWWSSLIKRLEPELVKDSQKTESFLQSNLPMDEVSDLLARLDHTEPSGPGSPETSQPYVADMTFSEALLSRGTQSRAPTPVASTPAASPARSSVLPLRPQPRNLPTPQSTPRASEACPWLNGSRTSSNTLRCSASVDALRNMRKQCFMNANLERCPPPMPPNSLALPSMRALMRSAESKQERSSGLATPFVSSPASSECSDSTVRTGRSRSSSISSNSSWSSWSSGPPRSLQATNDTPQFSSPLTKVISLPEERDSMNPFGSSDFRQSTTFRRNGSNSYSTSKPTLTATTTGDSIQTSVRTDSSGIRAFHDEGYGSGEERIAKVDANHLDSTNEVDAIDALMALSSRTGYPLPNHQAIRERGASLQQQHTFSSPSRGHKRTISRTSDSLQDRVCQFLQHQGMTDEVIEDSVPSTHDTQSEKQWQMPSKVWATARKPVSNSLDSKRLAIHCAVQQYSSAPDLASQYLKDQMVIA